MGLNKNATPDIYSKFNIYFYFLNSNNILISDLHTSIFSFSCGFVKPYSLAAFIDCAFYCP